MAISAFDAFNDDAVLLMMMLLLSILLLLPVLMLLLLLSMMMLIAVNDDFIAVNHDVIAAVTALTVNTDDVIDLIIHHALCHAKPVEVQPKNGEMTVTSTVP